MRALWSHLSLGGQVGERECPGYAATREDGSSGSAPGAWMTASLRAGRGVALPWPASAPGVAHT